MSKFGVLVMGPAGAGKVDPSNWSSHAIELICLDHLLYSHDTAPPTLTSKLLEATFVSDKAKFFAGTLSAMSAMIMLELPHVNILSKIDLVKGLVGKKELKRFVDPDQALLDDEDTGRRSAAHTVDVGNPAEVDTVMSGGSFKQLKRAVAKLIDDFSMVSFLKLDVREEDSVG